MYFKEFSCKTGGGFRLRKICKQDACRDLFSAPLTPKPFASAPLQGQRSAFRRNAAAGYTPQTAPPRLALGGKAAESAHAGEARMGFLCAALSAAHKRRGGADGSAHPREAAGDKSRRNEICTISTKAAFKM